MLGTAAAHDGQPPFASQVQRSEDLGLPVAKRQRVTARQDSLLRLCPKRNAEGPQPSSKRRSSGKCSISYNAVGDTFEPLSYLSDGPLMMVSNFLGYTELAAMDAACRLLLALNSRHCGPWFHAGDRAFHGTEIDIRGGLLSFDGEHEHVSLPDLASNEAFEKSWKGKYALFHLGAPTFSKPFDGAEIRHVENADEVAYCSCRLRTDQLASRPNSGVYIEVEVLANADNLSLAVVDFENPGGCSSVTFSPETGAVLLERKVREEPRTIEGKYIHLLPPSPGRHFEGTMGLYLLNGQLAFYRRWGPSSRTAIKETTSTWAPWETTGFCTDLRWAQGPRLCTCLAFRDEGAYNVRISKVSRQPPVTTSHRGEAYQDSKWSLLFGDDDHPLAI
jgi:hypothetical protein